MIAPEPGEGIKKQAGRLGLLKTGLLLSALIFAALEFSRPYFFLTDDNLDGGLPFFIEMGHHLLHGQSPFYSDHLFGEHYYYLRDISFFAWHPLFFLVSLLAATPFSLAIIDVNAFVFLMLSTAGFINLAWYLRREMALQVSDGRIIFYALSFTYTVMALATGASWFNFLANQSALPWLVLGILQKSWRNGIGLVAVFALHEFLGGHFSPHLATSIFLSLFALAVSLSRRSPLPLGCWILGKTAATLILLPMLCPTLEGFSHTIRSLGVPLEDLGQYNIPLRPFPMSIFCGMSLWLIQLPDNPYTTYMLALGSSAAIWCLPFALASRAKWRDLEAITLGLTVLIAIMVIRPVWISKIMLHLPVLKAMRWPFRELIQFMFFLHLFMLLRPPAMSLFLQRLGAICGASLLIISFAFYPFAFSFNAMPMDRQLLFSGEFDQYWAKVRPLLKPTDRVVVLIPLNLYLWDRFNEPYCLLGTYNYACMAGITNAEGYSQTIPKDQLYIKQQSYYPYGAFLPIQKESLLKEQPGLKFITLENLRPLKITLSSGDGPTIDLTPFTPPEVRNPNVRALQF